jgi:hypothetical protein
MRCKSFFARCLRSSLSTDADSGGLRTKGLGFGSLLGELAWVGPGFAAVVVAGVAVGWGLDVLSVDGTGLTTAVGLRSLEDGRVGATRKFSEALISVQLW